MATLHNISLDTIRHREPETIYEIQLHDYIHKALSLLTYAIRHGLDDDSLQMQHYYLSSIYDMLEEAKISFNNLLSER